MVGTIPRYAPAHVGWGVALRHQGKLDSAIRHQRKALRLAPGYSEAHNALGYALREKGDLAGALQNVRAASIPNTTMSEPTRDV